MKIFLPYLIKKTNITFSLLFFLLVVQGTKAQSVGDYRTVAAGTNWSSLNSWERWGGSAWATPTVGEGYPGQNSGTGNVIIRYGGSKTLDVSPASAIGSLNVGDGTVSGSGISAAAATLTIGSFTLAVSGNVVISKADLGRNGTLNNGSGIVKVGGTLSLAGAGVYTASTGTLEYNASGSQNIFNTTYYNLVTSGSGTKTIQGATTVSHDLTIGIGTTLDQASFATTLGNASVLTVNGTLDFTVTAGLIKTGSNLNATLTMGSSGLIKTADQTGLGPVVNGSLQNTGTGIWTTTSIDTSGTIEYYGSLAAQKVTDMNYNNLVITGTSQTKTWTLAATRTIAGTVTINGNFTLSAAMQTVRVGGNWAFNTGAFDAGTSIIDLNGSTQQILGGSLATTFNNLTISNASGAILGIDQTINGTLSLTGGNFDIGNKILTFGLGSPAISGSFSASRMIIADGGVVRKKANSMASASYYFPIGDGASSANGAEYTPVSLSVISSVSYTNAYIDVSLRDIKHPNNASTANYLTRYWNITQTGITSCVATVTGTYINSSSDFVGTVGGVKAAQLNGVFSQTSNPWIKTGGGVLFGNLTYTGAALTDGQTSVFTGITGADPTVIITGGGVGSCDTNVNFNLGTSVTGDPNILYSWSPTTFLNNATIANPIVASPTTTISYNVTIRDGNGITATSPASTITISSTTTWNAGAWFPCVPNATTDAIIKDTFTSAGTDIIAKSLTVNNNAIVVISSDDSVTLDGALTVDAGSSVTFENNANLIQSGTTNTNSGKIAIKRNSSALKRLDYTLWSSPVAGEKLKTFSPDTVKDRFYTYNSGTNVYDVVLNPVFQSMVVPKGYLIRLANFQPDTPTIWTGVFSGVPNNGDYSFTMSVGIAGKRFNLVGNPYPSPISAVSFVNNPTNSSNITGTLYFWRKTNGASGSSYCTWTAGGGFVSNNNAQAFNLNNVIQTGQGFLVEAKGNGSTLNFNNSMRVDNHANQFFKTVNTIERNRIWLNASNNLGAFSQTMVGYITDATQNFDAGIDGRYINDGDFALTSLIESTSYAIQGRSLPFDDSDVVPLSFEASTPGEYKITIDHVDGLFENNQDIYLKDNLAGITHDLKTGSYSFVSDAGTFASRFEVVYKTAQLGINTPLFNANQVVVYKNSANDIVINTGNIIMDSVQVFDIRGRLLEEKKGVDNTQMTINSGLTAEVLLVKITSKNGETVTKKIIR